jgi:hypothetical protein
MNLSFHPDVEHVQRAIKLAANDFADAMDLVKKWIIFPARERDSHVSIATACFPKQNAG